MHADSRVIAASERRGGLGDEQDAAFRSTRSRRRGEAEAVVALGVDHVGSVVLSAADWKQPELERRSRAYVLRRPQQPDPALPGRGRHRAHAGLLPAGHRPLLRRAGRRGSARN
ncbi:MAG: hypothetical protein MZV70_00110 [Desulfobacterales bacterium]|nr:hypothetical protein [Desulfobacterales bacterium]